MKTLLTFDPATIVACALNILLPVTALALVAVIAARYGFRHNPTVRYCVCLAGLLLVLLSPLVVMAQHKLGFALVNVSLPTGFSLLSAPDTKVFSAKTVSAEAADLTAASHPMEWLPRSVYIVLLVWAVGVLWGIVRFVHGWKAAFDLTRDARPWTASAHVETWEPLERLLGCALPPVFTSSRVVSPVALGLFRPMVLLPEGLTETVPPTQLRHILLHECAHITLRHTVGGVVARVAGIVFWPHPLIHLLCRELARAREEVCDNVASQEDGVACYARTLFAMAQGMFPTPTTSSVLALLGPETSLEARITGLLDPRRNRMVRVKRWKLWAVTGTAVCALASTTVVRVIAAESETTHVASTGSDHSEELRVKRTAEALAIAGSRRPAAEHKGADLPVGAINGGLRTVQLQPGSGDSGPGGVGAGESGGSAGGVGFGVGGRGGSGAGMGSGPVQPATHGSKSASGKGKKIAARRKIGAKAHGSASTGHGSKQDNTMVSVYTR